MAHDHKSLRPEDLEEWKAGPLAKAQAKASPRRPEFTTPSGQELQPLYTPRDRAREWDYRQQLGFPGEYPFTRGVQPTMYRGRLWTMRQYAGFGNAEDTNRRFRYLLEQGQTGLSVAFDLPTQIGYDSDAELAALTQWVVTELGADVPLHFSAFHPDWKMRDHPPTPPATLKRARQIAIDNGVHYAYVGNVHDPAGDSTWCHRCGELLIGRDWYELTEWNLTAAGACKSCGTPCAGVFESLPGRWGSRRQPVRLANYR